MVRPVPPTHFSVPKPDATVDSPLGCGGAVPVEILSGKGPIPGVDFVPTERPPGVAPAKTKGAGRWLKVGTDLMKVRGWAVRERLIQLHCFEGQSLKQCAKTLGRHPKRIAAIWAGVVRDVSGGSDPDKKAEIRAFADLSLRRFAQEGLSMFSEGAAYGAVGVQAIRALCELHGLKPDEAAAAGFSLEDVGREVRVVSPLLMDKMDRVAALRGPSVGSSEGGRAAANARWAKVIPVEGSPVGAGGVEPG